MVVVAAAVRRAVPRLLGSTARVEVRRDWAVGARVRLRRQSLLLLLLLLLRGDEVVRSDRREQLRSGGGRRLHGPGARLGTVSTDAGCSLCEC